MYFLRVSCTVLMSPCTIALKKLQHTETATCYIMPHAKKRKLCITSLNTQIISDVPGRMKIFHLNE